MKSLGQSVISNSSLLGGVKIIEKSLGLVSILILARILTPEDFGVVAIVMIFIFFFETVGYAGGEQYLIQKTVVDNDDINSAFTLNLGTKIVLFLLLIALVPYISDFYKNPDLTNVLYFASSILLIRSVANPGLALLKKSLDFRLIAKATLYTKLITFVAVLTLAYFTQSYWALIIADVLNVVIFTIATYIIHPYRPKPCVKKIREQFNFSQWIFLRSTIGFIRSQGDRIIVSKLFAANLMGEFHMARNLASLPSQDIILPATEPLLSSFSKVKDNTEKLIYQFTLSILIVSCLVLPISSFIYFHSDLIVAILLGSQWVHASSILSGLSPLVATAVLGSILGQVCIAKNKPAVLFGYDIVSFIITLSILLIFSDLYIGDFALLKSTIEITCFIAFLFYISTLLSFNPLRTIAEILLITLFSVAAGYISSHIQMDNMNIVLKIVLFFFIFSFFYLALLLLFHYTIYKKTQQGMHIHYLVKHNFHKASKRIFKHN